ncbi:hypothetical protein BK816_07460 [Boudabousia tangfeifanii]|uniref:HTH merR-type domain-containing protein n=1 Tax=Boudabousia tangfeifanii TaxID=1912795 RepID=A0A1D9MLN7_9ACTO|nr:hypothetical protein BK816_07460 [Boudabousia tangfeifanii]
MSETLYVISVAAELAGMHPQTLRQYDRLGLVKPRRTMGRGRRYTETDVRTLRRVQQLSQEEGINLAGIRRILDLERRLERAERQLRQVAMEQARAAQRQPRVFAADASGQVYETAFGREIKQVWRLLPPGRD